VTQTKVITGGGSDQSTLPVEGRGGEGTLHDLSVSPMSLLDATADTNTAENVDFVTY